jgi:hypothetical protein
MICLEQEVQATFSLHERPKMKTATKRKGLIMDWLETIRNWIGPIIMILGAIGGLLTFIYKWITGCQAKLEKENSQINLKLAEQTLEQAKTYGSIERVTQAVDKLWEKIDISTAWQQQHGERLTRLEGEHSIMIGKCANMGKK